MRGKYASKCIGDAHKEAPVKRKTPLFTYLSVHDSVIESLIAA